MPEENRECSLSKNVKINWKTLSLLCFANFVSSHDSEFVVQNNFRRKDIRIIDKFMKDVHKHNNLFYCTKRVVEILHMEETIYI